MRRQNILDKDPEDVAGVFKKLKEVQYCWGIQDSGERMRAEASQGRGKGLGYVDSISGRVLGPAMPRGQITQNIKHKQYYNKFNENF